LVERLRKQTVELEQELEDIDEQAIEKIEAKSKKKRESNDRFEEAKRIYHDEEFISEAYLKGFLAMKNMFMKVPEDLAGYSI